MPKSQSKAAPRPRISRYARLGDTFGITPPSSIELDPDAVRTRAYERFLARGGSIGTPEEDWLEAERELRERRWNGLI